MSRKNSSRISFWRLSICRQWKDSRTAVFVTTSFTRRIWAFEKPVGGSPKERHHVRFWRTEKLDEGRVAWIGSAAYDIGVEFSRTTGEITHHISPNVDAERDLFIADLTNAGRVSELRWIDGFHTELRGRNGGGDRWRTDGRLAVVVLQNSGRARYEPRASGNPIVRVAVFELGSMSV